MTRRLLLLLCFTATGLAAPIAAQQRIVVRAEPGTPVVATEILVATGPADEPTPGSGLGYLAARTVVAPIQPTLDSLGARLDVAAMKDAITFTLVAAPDVWEEVTNILLVALFRDPPDRQWLVRQQRAITAELASRQSNPADAVVRAADEALFGAEHPWGRSTVGDPASVRKLTLEDVDRHLRGQLSSRRAVIAVVGPLDPASARAHLAGYLDVDLALPPLEWQTPEPADSMVKRDYNSITTWVSVSYPFAADADVEALEFLARLALDDLSFSPSRGSVYNAQVEVTPRRAGGELRVTLVSPPDEAGRWADRVQELVEEVAEREMIPEVFRARLRRHRGERLHALAGPEDRARELARQLLVRGRLQPLGVDVEEMTIDRLRRAVRSLEAPTVVLLGPIPEQTAQKGD